jgi:hypothetical protein
MGMTSAEAWALAWELARYGVWFWSGWAWSAVVQTRRHHRETLEWAARFSALAERAEAAERAIEHLSREQAQRERERMQVVQ